MDTDASAGTPTERSDREWALWAIQFAQADLESWQEPDWLSALQDAMAFGASHDESAHAMLPLTINGPRTDQTPSLEKITTCLRLCQKALRRFLRELEQTMRVPLMEAKILFRGICLFSLPDGRPAVTYVPREKTRARQLTTEMLLRLGELFLQGHLAQLKRCPGCRRCFLAAGRQRFDSLQCRRQHHIRNAESGAEAASDS